MTVNEVVQRLFLRDDSNLKVTKHFTWKEFFVSNVAKAKNLVNAPHTFEKLCKVMENIQVLAELLENIRSAHSNKPIIINSGFRCPKLNSYVDGSLFSHHMDGLAVDITSPDFEGLKASVEFLCYSMPNVYYYFNDEKNYIHLQLNKLDK